MRPGLVVQESPPTHPGWGSGTSYHASFIGVAGAASH
jgi:hypothetical protein